MGQHYDIIDLKLIDYFVISSRANTKLVLQYFRYQHILHCFELLISVAQKSDSIVK